MLGQHVGGRGLGLRSKRATSESMAACVASAKGRPEKSPAPPPRKAEPRSG